MIFEISIHALVWSATGTDIIGRFHLTISIHALAWSTAPPDKSAVNISKISIHAPYKGRDSKSSLKKKTTRSAVSIIIPKFKRNCQRPNSRITLFVDF